MHTLPLIREMVDDFVSLFFPKICIHCGNPLVYQEEHICIKCRLSLPKTNFHLVPENPLYQKLAYEPKVRQATAFLHYYKKGIAQTLIHHLKYKELPEIGVMIGEWYGSDLLEMGWNPDYIIPVPLHHSKLARRGYNQSERFADGLSRKMNVPVAQNLISRVVKTTTQTRKSKVQRLENVSSIYETNDQEKLNGKNVLVVDDVLTTGATIGELVMLLAASGVNDIYVAVIAAGK